MFGSGPQMHRATSIPAWVSDIRNWLGVPSSVLWIHQPKGKGVYGCAWTSLKLVQIFTDTNQMNDECLMVVLHEFAHALDGGREKVPNRKKPTAHGPRFWKIACDLYQFFGLLEYAKTGERYAGGRKAVKQRLKELSVV